MVVQLYCLACQQQTKQLPSGKVAEQARWQAIRLCVCAYAAHIKGGDDEQPERPRYSLALLIAGCPAAPASSVSNGSWPSQCPNQPGDTCTATCSDGFNGTVTSLCSKGAWSATSGSCKENGTTSVIVHAFVPLCRPRSCMQTIADVICRHVWLL